MAKTGKSPSASRTAPRRKPAAAKKGAPRKKAAGAKRPVAAKRPTADKRPAAGKRKGSAKAKRPAAAKRPKGAKRPGDAKRPKAAKRPAAAKSGKAVRTARKATAKRSAAAKRSATTKRPGAAKRPKAAKRAGARAPARGKAKKPIAPRSTTRKRAPKTAARKTPSRRAAGTKRPAGAKGLKSAATARTPSFPKAPKAKPVRLKRVAQRVVRHGARKAGTARDGRRAPAIRPPFEAYRGAKPYVFISYSHDNMREVFNIIRKLNANRYRIWYDEGIEPGNEWPEEVGRAILNCSQFMVFMSPTAADSRNVRNEINLATSDAKSILVVHLQETELSEGLRLQIGTVQNLNRQEMTEPEFLDKLKKVLSTELRS